MKHSSAFCSVVQNASEMAGIIYGTVNPSKEYHFKIGMSNTEAVEAEQQVGNNSSSIYSINGASCDPVTWE